MRQEKITHEKLIICNQTKVGEMGRVCSTCKKKEHAMFWQKNAKEKEKLEDLGIEGG